MDEHNTAEVPRSSAGRQWIPLLGLGLVGLALVGLTWYFWPTRILDPDHGRFAAEDPRLTFPTPYVNVHPDVQYVGDEACNGCHLELAQSYSHHPMGRALFPMEDAPSIERYTPEAFNPFEADGLEYAVLHQDDGVIHRERALDAEGNLLCEIEAEMRFAVGSGTRARSYLWERDGFLFQSPITWFSEEQRWDLSPGYENRNLHFSRTVAPGCLFCHCSYAEHVPDTANQYREPIFEGFVIGCERCHGPGELHVRRHRDREAYTGIDETIVNPARLEHPLREAVCHQCHVQGMQRVVARGRGEFDFRPGLPLHLFLMDFVDQRNQRADVKFVSSVEQLMVSRCYQATEGAKKLGCISCHDPHYHPPPEKKVEHYRQRCLNCHTVQSCALPEPERRAEHAEDSCIACHMPATSSEVNHTSITDHRIPRFIDPTPPPLAEDTPPAPHELVPFAADLRFIEEDELARNLAIALMELRERTPPADLKQAYALKALPLLDDALERDPHDRKARIARAFAYRDTGRSEEALAEFERVLQDSPALESTLADAGFVALELGRSVVAHDYFSRAIEVNPWRWHYYNGQAIASFRLGEWDRSLRECAEVLRLHPTDTSIRSLIVQCYLSQGYRDRAQSEFETLRELTSAERRADLERWYEEVKRRILP